MSKQKSEFLFTGIVLQSATEVPIYRQLYEALRQAILSRRLRPGQRLPPSRQLAETLGVSRTTVLLAFDHLFSEGYISGKSGSGTFVSATIPEHLLQVPATAAPPAVGSVPQLSERGKHICRISSGNARRQQENLRPFRPGIPGLREFPYDIWNRLATRQIRSLHYEAFGYSDPAGYAPLREAIAGYLRVARAVNCEAEQVVIVNGSQQALDLIARVLLDPGEAAWMEDPGYGGAKEALRAAGISLRAVPVDAVGLMVAEGIRRHPDARLAYVTPSHQYPLGVTMSLPRRLELLEWAARADAWIIEDDYDSEYRYAGRPISSLQGLDRQGRVIYLGTFSKVLFPALRLGYLVVPPGLADAFIAAKAVSDRNCPLIEQAVVTSFITEGHFGRHLRRMRLLYQARQEALLEAGRKHLGGLLEMTPAETGLHLIGWLPEGADDRAISVRAEQAGIQVPPLSAYSLEEQQRPGLMLGYAAFDELLIEKSIRQLRRVLMPGMN